MQRLFKPVLLVRFSTVALFLLLSGYLTWVLYTTLYLGVLAPKTIPENQLTSKQMSINTILMNHVLDVLAKKKTMIPPVITRDPFH